MMDRNFHVAQLDNLPDALNAIRQLEEQLSDQSGEDIALVAFASEEDQHTKD
ncbi:hypothetical protein [Paenibacillus sp. 1011MAR3C5]|uniref:hypothetical protein n=1 Tax=Paenibacillus sp. 1011MAR3C5 TaxID=1675787 RepID=UPI0016001C3E|nr:hypothetical protein [Paenibacillus sp. 1011MAR3C5]